MAAVWRWRGGEDQAGGGHILQQPAFCSGDHQDQAEERLTLRFLHPGTDSHFTFCRKIATNVTFLVKIAAGELDSGNSLDVTSLNHSPLATFTVASAPFLPVKTCTPARPLPDPFHFIAFQEAESNRLCRRLQLKDIIPVEMQRLTKYPLLLENIAKYTGTVVLLKL